jgi:hypothetical protein
MYSSSLHCASLAHPVTARAIRVNLELRGNTIAHVSREILSFSNKPAEDKEGRRSI